MTGDAPRFPLYIGFGLPHLPKLPSAMCGNLPEMVLELQEPEHNRESWCDEAILCWFQSLRSRGCQECMSSSALYSQIRVGGTAQLPTKFWVHYGHEWSSRDADELMWFDQWNQTKMLLSKSPIYQSHPHQVSESKTLYWVSCVARSILNSPWFHLLLSARSVV